MSRSSGNTLGLSVTYSLADVVMSSRKRLREKSPEYGGERGRTSREKDASTPSSHFLQLQTDLSLDSLIAELVERLPPNNIVINEWIRSGKNLFLAVFRDAYSKHCFERWITPRLQDVCTLRPPSPRNPTVLVTGLPAHGAENVLQEILDVQVRSAKIIHVARGQAVVALDKHDKVLLLKKQRLHESARSVRRNTDLTSAVANMRRYAQIVFSTNPGLARVIVRIQMIAHCIKLGYGQLFSFVLENIDQLGFWNVISYY
ncbi:hypothetical protein HDE_00504 [Halotydeus destructor]|nr:hypothetical protein HDE_00504 [Halotydeus destructor]